MGKTSSAVKDRYNKKAYDTILLRVPKGKKQVITDYAEKRGESVNGFLNRAVDEAMKNK